jgi:hypothetical protein
MAITTYTELRTAVANWLARDDLSDRIPEFIALAEAKFNRELRHPRMEKRSYTSVDTDTNEPEFITLPSNFQTMRRIRLSGVTGKPGLEYVTATQAETLRYGLANVTAQPAYYTIIDDEIELIPTPGQEYELEMVYRANIPALASNSTNWLLTLAPDAYLYGALLEAAPYMKDDGRISVWALGFSNAIDSLNRLGAEVSFASGPSAVVLENPAP